MNVFDPPPKSFSYIRHCHYSTTVLISWHHIWIIIIIQSAKVFKPFLIRKCPITDLKTYYTFSMHTHYYHSNMNFFPLFEQLFELQIKSSSPHACPTSCWLCLSEFSLCAFSRTCVQGYRIMSLIVFKTFSPGKKKKKILVQLSLSCWILCW